MKINKKQQKLRTFEISSKGRKAQLAIEYLTTYGWVLLVVVVGFGFLTYFGFLNPNKYISDTCWFGDQLSCEDFAIQYVNSNEADVFFMIRNNFPRDIEVTDIVSLDTNNVFSGCTINTHIGIGQRRELSCTVNAPFVRRDKEGIAIELTYRRNNSVLNPLHVTEGEVFTTVY